MALRSSISQARRDDADSLAKKDEAKRLLPQIGQSGAAKRDWIKAQIAERTEKEE
jgi:hypothetical protein